MRRDKLIPGLQNWIYNLIGKEFIIFPTFELTKVFKDSSIITPLIFLLSEGSDPCPISFGSQKKGVWARDTTVSHWVRARVKELKRSFEWSMGPFTKLPFVSELDARIGEEMRTIKWKYAQRLQNIFGSLRCLSRNFQFSTAKWGQDDPRVTKRVESKLLRT